MGGMSFGDDPKQVRLADFRFRLKERFLYEYDFGDAWQHEVRVDQKLPSWKTTSFGRGQR